MQNRNSLTNMSAARATASLFGVLAGFGGAVHGIGEILQGNVAPNGLVVNSWTQGPIAAYMGGEPGLTIVPNLMATGVLSLLTSLAVMAWAAFFVQRQNGGWILIGLAILMLLVGGGFAPPIIAILAGVAGLGIGSRHSWWRAHVPINIQRALARLWPWTFGACAINGVFLVIGSVILVFFLNLNNPELFVYSFLLAVLLLLLTIVTGVAYDLKTASAPHSRQGVRATP